MTIYVDLDGVLANMEGYVRAHFGDNWKAEIEKPNWGLVGDIHQRLYRDLHPMEDAHTLWNFLNETYHDVQVLTAIPKRAHFPYAVNDKREWVHKHFGKNVKVNFGPYAYDKQFHCKPGDILIDDMQINIDQWNAVGGYGILHTSAESSLEEFAKVIFGKSV